MVPVILHDGRLYVGDHVMLTPHVHILDGGVRLRRAFIASHEDMYICGFLEKSKVEEIISTGETEDCGRVRALYAYYRKATGERSMPINMLKMKNDFAPMKKKIKIRLRFKRVWRERTK